MTRIALIAAFLIAPFAAFADSPEIVDVSVVKTGMTWRMSVTLKHADTGWEHFADGWEVVDANGKRLGHRKLMHPHVEEQPFTRTLSSLVFPDGTREVFVRAHCSVKGWSETRFRVELDP